VLPVVVPAVPVVVPEVVPVVVPVVEPGAVWLRAGVAASALVPAEVPHPVMIADIKIAITNKKYMIPFLNRTPKKCCNECQLGLDENGHRRTLAAGLSRKSQEKT
jgi:hypothetical protein